MSDHRNNYGRYKLLGYRLIGGVFDPRIGGYRNDYDETITFKESQQVSEAEYYKARISELERELEAAHAELGQYGADIKMLEKKLEEADEQKLWELHLAMIKRWDNVTGKLCLEQAQLALKAWKERK